MRNLLIALLVLVATSQIAVASVEIAFAFAEVKEEKVIAEAFAEVGTGAVRGVSDVGCQCDLTGVCNCCDCKNCPCSAKKTEVIQIGYPEAKAVTSYPVVSPPVYYNPPVVNHHSGGCVGNPIYYPPIYNPPPVFRPIRRVFPNTL